MKFRSGFVSNSSSSSFYILGTKIDNDDKAFKVPEKPEDWAEKEWNEFVEEYGEDTYTIVYESLEPPLVIHDEYDYLYIGVYPSEIRDEETLKQCKERVANMVNKLLNNKITCEDITFYEGD